MVAVVHECTPGAFVFLSGDASKDGTFLVLCELHRLDQNNEGMSV